MYDNIVQLDLRCGTLNIVYSLNSSTDWNSVSFQSLFTCNPIHVCSLFSLYLLSLYSLSLSVLRSIRSHFLLFSFVFSFFVRSLLLPMRRDSGGLSVVERDEERESRKLRDDRERRRERKKPSAQKKTRDSWKFVV